MIINASYFYRAWYFSCYSVPVMIESTFFVLKTSYVMLANYFEQNLIEQFINHDFFIKRTNQIILPSIEHYTTNRLKQYRRINCTRVLFFVEIITQLRYYAKKCEEIIPDNCSLLGLNRSYSRNDGDLTARRCANFEIDTDINVASVSAFYCGTADPQIWGNLPLL